MNNGCETEVKMVLALWKCRKAVPRYRMLDSRITIAAGTRNDCVLDSDGPGCRTRVANCVLELVRTGLTERWKELVLLPRDQYKVSVRIH